MKKLIVSLIMIVALLAIAWLGSSWWIGKQTEQLVRDKIETTPLPLLGGLKQELLSYDRSLFSATAVTKAVIEDPAIKNFFNVSDIQLIHHIQHGPLLTQGGLKLGWAQGRSEIDVNALSEEQQTWINSKFKGLAPLTAHTTVDLKHNVAYHLQTNPLEAEDAANNRLKIAGLDAFGTVQTAGELSPINLTIKDFEWRDNEATLSVPMFELAGQTDLFAALPSGTITGKADKMSVLNAGETEPVSFALQFSSNTRQTKPSIEGSTEVVLDRFQGPEVELRKVTMKADFAGFNTEGLLALQQLQEKMNSLQAQLQWNEEETEVPEGRQNQSQLMVELEETASQVIVTLFDKVLKAGESRIIYQLDVDSNQGPVKLEADLNYAGAGKTFTLSDIMTYELNDWGKLARGFINVTAAKTALPEDVQSLMAYPVNNKAVVEDTENYKIELKLAGDHAELNGHSVAFNDLATQFIPPMFGGLGGLPELGEEDEMQGLNIPPDILRQIEENGFTPEVMQQLEESDDVPPEMLQILKQVQGLPADREAEDEANTTESPEAGLEAEEAAAAGSEPKSE